MHASEKIPVLTGKEVLAQLLAQFIVSVSAYHNVVGKVGEYVAHPDFVAGAILPDREISVGSLRRTSFCFVLFCNHSANQFSNVHIVSTGCSTESAQPRSNYLHWHPVSTDNSRLHSFASNRR
eukprot:SAG31_NODE_1173_length_9543_cov_8.654913_5_plen_123_part_00